MFSAATTLRRLRVMLAFREKYSKKVTGIRCPKYETPIIIPQPKNDIEFLKSKFFLIYEATRRRDQSHEKTVWW